MGSPRGSHGAASGSASGSASGRPEDWNARYDELRDRGRREFNIHEGNADAIDYDMLYKGKYGGGPKGKGKGKGKSPDPIVSTYSAWEGRGSHYATGPPHSYGGKGWSYPERHAEVRGTNSQRHVSLRGSPVGNPIGSASGSGASSRACSKKR
jgi:hypothetical protein